MAPTKQRMKYNLKHGHVYKNNRAKYRKQVQAVAQENQRLAKSLVEVHTKSAELETATSRQQNTQCPALPQMESSLKTNLQLTQAMVNNQSRPIELLQNMTPERDSSLADISNMDLSNSQDRSHQNFPSPQHSTGCSTESSTQTSPQAPCVEAAFERSLQVLQASNAGVGDLLRLPESLVNLSDRAKMSSLLRKRITDL